MSNPQNRWQGEWHDNWLVDTLLRLGFITLLTWVAIAIAIYLGSAGETLPALPFTTVPEGTVTPTPSRK